MYGKQTLIFVVLSCVVLVLLCSGFFCLLPWSLPFSGPTCPNAHICTFPCEHAHINIYIYIKYLCNIYVCMAMSTLFLHSLPTFPMQVGQEPCNEERQREKRETLSLQPPKQCCLPSFPSLRGWQAEGTDAKLRKWFSSDGIWLLGTLHWYLCWLLCRCPWVC